MKFKLITFFLFIAIVAGCTSAQVNTLETDTAKAVNTALVGLDFVETHPESLNTVESSLSLLETYAPQDGPMHQAIEDAKTVIEKFKTHQATVMEVKAALNFVVVAMKSLQAPTVAPVNSN